MMAKTHIAFATSLAAIPLFINPELSTYLSQNIKALPIILFGLTFGALFPDIDEPGSSISRKFIIAQIVSLLLILIGTKHRGFTHKFFFGVLFLAIAIYTKDYINSDITLGLFAFTFGIFAHHLGDMMVGGGKNKGGIYNYFSPLYSPNTTVKFLPYFLRCYVFSFKEYIYFYIFSAINLFAMFILASSVVTY